MATGLDAVLGTSRESVQRVQRHYVRFFRDCSRVLDLGCGPGYFLELLRDTGISCEGVDSDEEAVAQCRSNGLDAVQGDVLEHLERGQAVNGIFCAHLLEHLSVRQAEVLFRGIARHLLPGGVAVVVTPNPRALFSHLDQFWIHPGHVRFYHPQLLHHLALQAGLEVVAEGEHPPGNPLFGDRLPRIRQLSEALARPRQASAVRPRTDPISRVKAVLRARVLGIVSPWIDQLSREVAEVAEFAADVAAAVDRPPECYLVARTSA